MDSPSSANIADLVDPVWYRTRYPDVAEADMDPVEHYHRFGQSEGRFPTAAAELSAADAVVDAAWYLARYPDVAQTGADPIEHYCRYGRAEGRHPNPDQEPREIWNTRFDPVWYRARNADLGASVNNPLEHFLRVGILEGRAANASEEDREAWRTTFDPDWYLARNPDVGRLGIDPLEHFITVGIIDRRLPNGRVVIEARDVTEARIDRLKGEAFADEVALFVTHTADGPVKPHVDHHVACLQQCGIQCVLIAVCDLADVAVTGEAIARADHVFRRANAGFDFAAWAHVLRRHPDILRARIVYLINDSVFGPTHAATLDRVVARIRASQADLVGLTENADRGWHVQSYFLALKQRFVASEAGRAFFDNVVSYAHKNDVVNAYETQLARYAMGHGFQVDVLFPTPDWLDPTLHNWKRLLRAGFPYLKVGTARGLVRTVETADWRAEMSVRGYDTRAADRTLARLALETRGEPSSPDGTDLDEERALRAEMHTFLADRGEVVLTAEEPRVSFVMVVNRRPERLLRVVRALAQGRPAQTEFVIVDNASIDDTHHVLGRLTGATILTDVAPVPFPRAARQAVAMTRAGIVVLVRLDGGPDREPDVPDRSVPQGGPERAFLDVLESLPPAGDGVTYRVRRSPDDASWRTFDVIHRGRRLGTAYAMLRRDAPDALEHLCVHGPDLVQHSHPLPSALRAAPSRCVPVAPASAGTL